MALLKIVTQNGTVLDFVKETLTIKKENNALITDFKVAHSSVPFLIIENKAAQLGLGPRDLTSIKKTRSVRVTVFENDIEMYGELQILSYISGFRKCNLKYATELLSIMNKKISDFMPTVSVLPAELTPDAFVETATEIFDLDENWPAYVASHINQGYPAVKWNFPTMKWKHKFGEDLPADDPWKPYTGFVNFFIDDVFLLNTGVYTAPSVIVTNNVNVPMPQIYLLAPLFYALKSIGLAYGGNFTESAFIKKIMMLSFKNNLTKITLETVNNFITWSGSWSTIVKNGYPTFRRRVIYDITETGTYTIKCKFILPLQTSTSAAPVYTYVVVRRFKPFVSTYTEVANEVIFRRRNNTAGEVIEGDFTMEFEAGDKIYFDYQNITQTMPTLYEVSYRISDQDKDFYQMHPTLQLGRYLPDWTFGTYLNEMKKLFNLDIESDDFSKKLILNFNENWIVTAKPEIVTKSLAISSYEQTPNSSFLLKYDNDEDAALWITSTGTQTYVAQKSDFSQTLDSKFKFIPVNSTAELSDVLEDKNGIGLLLYDETASPDISKTYNGKSLAISGNNGIYENFHKVWLKFRLNASVIELNGGFTQSEISKIIKAKRIYIDHQEYVVASADYKELNQDNFSVSFKLHSVNF